MKSNGVDDFLHFSQRFPTALLSPHVRACSHALTIGDDLVMYCSLVWIQFVADLFLGRVLDICLM
jgi:hypothetical protein